MNSPIMQDHTSLRKQADMTIGPDENVYRIEWVWVLVSVIVQSLTSYHYYIATRIKDGHIPAPWEG